jgi:diadenosine tetraphosphatase ApaH/serine/threonine PP2A family protein phosphatase
MKPSGIGCLLIELDGKTAGASPPGSQGRLVLLRVLPQGPVQVSDDIEICHGTPFDEDHYVFDDRDASRAADAASRRICLFGHTHVPAVYATAQDPVVASDRFEDELRLPADAPVLINVGSVGQPRDGDPRAAYGLLEMPAGMIRLRRVAYDVKGAQAAILKAGLPAWLSAMIRWTSGSGMQRLWDVLLAQGVDPERDGWTSLDDARGISPDGSAIVGFGTRNGNSEAFLVIVPEPSALALLSLGGISLLRPRLRRHGVERPDVAETPCAKIAAGIP